MMNAYAVQLHSDSVEKEALRAVKSHIPKACNGTYLIQQESVLIYFGDCLIQRRILRIPKHGRLQQEILAEKQFFSYACPDLLALRGSFLIDANGVVRHQVVNDLPLGRNIDWMQKERFLQQIKPCARFL